MPANDFVSPSLPYKSGSLDFSFFTVTGRCGGTDDTDTVLLQYGESRAVSFSCHSASSSPSSSAAASAATSSATLASASAAALSAASSISFFLLIAAASPT